MPASKRKRWVGAVAVAAAAYIVTSLIHGIILAIGIATSQAETTGSVGGHLLLPFFLGLSAPACFLPLPDHGTSVSQARFHDAMHWASVVLMWFVYCALIYVGLSWSLRVKRFRPHATISVVFIAVVLYLICYGVEIHRFMAYLQSVVHFPTG